MVNPDKPVLVVEDESPIRNMLIENLEDVGFRAIGATDGLEAWNQLQQGLLPCLILLDLMMPHMDGWQFRALQQADPTLATIPVIILSAVQNPAQAAQGLHVQQWLSKPFDINRVIQVVRDNCTRP